MGKRADIAPEGSLRQSLVVRLRFASSALAQVSESVRDVREKSILFRPLTLMKVKFEWLRQTNSFLFRICSAIWHLNLTRRKGFDFKAAGRIRRMLGEYDIFPKIFRL